MSITKQPKTRKLSDIFYHDNTGSWRYRSTNVLENVVRIQATAARRNLTPVYFWRFRKDKSSVNETYREPTERGYDEPIVALFYIEHGAPVKKLGRTGSETEFDHTFKIDIAEAIRLGELFKTEDPTIDFAFFLPGPNDLYQWNQSIYEISDTVGERYYELVSRHVVWKGAAVLYQSDSRDPVRAIFDKRPELEAPRWLRST